MTVTLRQPDGKLTFLEAMLAGIVASYGAARGKVRVVYGNDLENMRKARTSFKDGNIIVTDMAQPSMIDLILRSGAVITNEGGLLSHAAIICRESDIPCIVGTRFATKVLTDGQEIQISNQGSISLTVS